MGRQWEENKSGIEDNEIALLIALWAVGEAVNTLAVTVRRLARVMARERRAPTASGVSGLPCAGTFDFQREAAPDVADDAIEAAALKDEPPSRPL